MDLLNMRNNAKSIDFMKKDKKFYNLVIYLRVWKLVTNAQFQLNISKIRQLGQKILGQGC